MRCTICYSTQFTLKEGFYYCNVCGQQGEGAREMETEELYTTIGRLKTPKKKAVDGDRQKQRKQRGETEASDPTVSLADRGLRSVDFPKHMEGVGYRLSTFTKLVCRISYILVHDLEAPDDLLKSSMLVLQTYLRKFGVAFTDEELAEIETEAFRPVVKRTKSEVAEAKRTKKDALKDEKQKRRSARMSTLGILDQLMFTEEVDNGAAQPGTSAAVPVEDQVDVDPFQTITTKLSTNAVNAASTIYLQMDAVLSIVYIGCLLSGATWIQLSDIYRWYREGYFGVTQTQLRALTFTVLWGQEVPMRSLKSRAKSAKEALYSAVQPLSESMRVLAFFVQFTGLPRSVRMLDFDQVCARLVHDLNLPAELLLRIQVLTQLLRPVTTECGTELYSFILPLSDNVRDNIMKRSRKTMGHSSFFWRAFGNDQRSRQWQLPSVEVKSMAVILFALRLMFGLDTSKRDINMGEADQDAEPFILSDWMLQLQQRLFVWQGLPAEHVLGQTFDGGSVSLTEPVSSAREVAAGQRRRFRRGEQFRGCLPFRARNSRQQTLFYTLFSDDRAKDTFGERSKEARYFPLRFQAKFNEDMRTTNLDSTNESIFFRSFKDDHLNFVTTDTGHQQAAPRTEKERAWIEMFPSSRSYVRFPVPEHICFPDFAKGYDESSPVILDDAVTSVYESSQRFMSAEFRKLVCNLALVIGERESLLFYTFLMVENMFFDRSKIRSLEEMLRHGKTVEYSITRQSGKRLSRKIQPLKPANPSLEAPLYKLSYHVIKARRAHRCLSEVSSDSEEVHYDRDPASAILWEEAGVLEREKLHDANAEKTFRGSRSATKKSVTLRPRPARNAMSSSEESSSASEAESSTKESEVDDTDEDPDYRNPCNADKGRRLAHCLKKQERTQRSSVSSISSLSSIEDTPAPLTSVFEEEQAESASEASDEDTLSIIDERHRMKIGKSFFKAEDALTLVTFRYW